MKAIETVYNGYRFRSRLEARWAVFFDAMGFDYDYELEGFDLDDAGYYLPDFWLPRVRMWAEVKPSDFNEIELNKAQSLVAYTKRPLLKLIGVPSRIPYWGIYHEESLNTENESEFEFVEWDVMLTNSDGYYKSENRFYTAGFLDAEYVMNNKWFDDMDIGVSAARQARFEHGETPVI